MRDKLNHMGVDWFHLDLTSSRSPGDYLLGLGTGSSELAVLDSNGRWFSPDEIRGVWCRSYNFHNGSPPEELSAKRFSRAEDTYCLEYLFYCLGHANWVNPVDTPFLTRRGVANRLIQSKIAASLGLHIPEQIISNDGEKLKKFLVEADYAVINKAISQGSSSESGPMYVRTLRLEKSHLEVLGRSSGCPVLLQRLVPKAYELRIAVVGDAVYAGAIDTGASGGDLVDSREGVHKGLSYYRYAVPQEEARVLIELNQRLGLRYSSMDFIRDLDGRLVFLEANPSGQWGFLQSHTGYPIAERIVQELLH
ncbi:hypothetical protein ABE424_18015 [Stenotrophomonas sp. TWI1149]|uniref:hypothetical protein n=1 Tax=unclassified Stenotrophomonas TaxID=196198 RepID=UPI00320B0593